MNEPTEKELRDAAQAEAVKIEIMMHILMNRVDAVNALSGICIAMGEVLVGTVFTLGEKEQDEALGKALATDGPMLTSVKLSTDEALKKARQIISKNPNIIKEAIRRMGGNPATRTADQKTSEKPSWGNLG